jgi:gliding motility-associated-like protein
VPNTTYTWTYTQTGGVVGASNGSGNIISQVLTIGGTVPGTVTYTVTPTAAGSCPGIPINITVTVNPIPNVSFTTPTSQFICTDGTVNIQMISNIPGTTFIWNVVQAGGVTGGVDGTGSSINQVLTNSGTIVGQAIYTVTPISNGCSGTPQTVSVTVYPKPVVTASPMTDTLCSGETTNIVLNSNVPGTVFSWTVLQTGLFGTAPGTGNSISQTLTTVGLTPGSATYTITPTVNGCIGEPITVTITVNPTPEVFNPTAPQPICSGDLSGITVTPNIPGTTIFWTVAQNGVTGASDGSASVNTPDGGIEIAQVLTTTGNAQGTVTYTITPINNGCSGKEIIVVIVVNPMPSITILDGVICVDSVTGALIYGYEMDTHLDEADYDFQWYLNGAIINTTSSYVAEEEGAYTVTIMNSDTGCTKTYTINVTESNPAQTATAVVTNYFEDGQAITVTVAGNGSYLYSLDGGAFQTSNVFLQVLPGVHTVTIQDAIGCTDITLTDIVTIGYPHFFTPNGDGYNDTWNIWSLRETQPNSEIHIYDRYGKLIKQIAPAGNGWDGTFNGQVLPSTDYWFTVKYKENGAEKEFKAHFSMKR